MKIIAQLNVYNSDLYLKEVLESIYNYVDRIVIIDGSFRKNIRPKYSTDNTREIVKSFYDIDNKIIYKKVCSKSQTKQRNRALKYIKNFDWLLIVDDDEIYKKKDMILLREFLSKTVLNCFRIRSFNFVNNYKDYYITQNMRVWKIEKRMKYVSANSVNTKKKIFNEHEAKKIPKIKMFHYSYIRKPNRLDIKIKQTREYQYGNKFPWYKKNGLIFRDSWKRKYFKGNHPAIMKYHPYRNMESLYKDKNK